MKIFNTSNFLIQGNIENDEALESVEDSAKKVISLANSALRSIKIFTAELQPSLYNRETIKKCFLNFLRGNRHAQIQILISDSTLALQCGHHLIHLAQELPSKVEIRITPEDYRNTGMSFLLLDNRGFIYQADQAIYSTCKYRANKLLDFFTPAWEQAEQDPQTRRVRI